MIEIQQLIVRAQVNGDDFEERDIVQTVREIIASYLNSQRVVKEIEKKEIIEECIRAILDEIEQKTRR